MVKRSRVAAGSRGMAGGQAIDLESVGKHAGPARARVHAHPQDRRADPRAVLLGARCGAGLRAEREPSTATRRRRPRLPGGGRRARREASTATLGKTAGKDAAQGKPTYVERSGLPRAKGTRGGLRAKALPALAARRRARRLRELADFIVLRKF
jgi:farnesyl diphosphate synthase